MRPKGADHFVRNEQHAVAIADLAHFLPVPGWRREAPAGVLYWLEENGGNRLGTFAKDGLFDLAGLPKSKGDGIVPVALGSVEVRSGDFDRSRDEWLEGRAVPLE